MPARETEPAGCPRVLSTILCAVSTRGLRSRYIHVMTVRRFSPKSFAALSTPTERMKVGRSVDSIVPVIFGETRKSCQGLSADHFRESLTTLKNQVVTIPGMDYKIEIGKRIKKARADKQWTLAELSRKTNDVLSFQRIGAYETGERMPGPSEATILGKALGVRPAFLMMVDDIQLPITPQEETMIKNWRELAGKERAKFFREIELAALLARDPASHEPKKVEKTSRRAGF